MRRRPGAMSQLTLPLVPGEADSAAVSGDVAGSVDAPRPLPPVTFVRRRGTRRYVLRLLDDGTVRVTVPWWGTQRGARAFVEAERSWIARQLERRHARAAFPWAPGREVLLDGERQSLVADVTGAVYLAGVLVARSLDGDAIRVGVSTWLRRQAREVLPRELQVLADRHGVPITGVSIRNQRSRWGSCSTHGTISLNWRLVQVPAFVREYVLVHELMHRRQMNHSSRFWRLVAEACPRYLDARRWLRREGAALFES